MPPDIAPLEKAVAALERATEHWTTVHPSDPAYEHARSAVVLNFQIVLEMSLLFMRRFSAENGANRKPALNVADILRIAAAEELIGDPERWLAHRKLRNITSHAYNEEKAARVAESAFGFLEDAQAFVARLRAKTAEAK